MHSDYAPPSHYENNARRPEPYYPEIKGESNPNYLQQRQMSMAGILSSVHQSPREYYPTTERYLDNREVYEERRRYDPYDDRRREPPRYGGYDPYTRYDEYRGSYYDQPPTYRYDERYPRNYYEQRTDPYREQYYPPEPRGYNYERYPPARPDDYRDRYPPYEPERHEMERKPVDKNAFPIVTIQLKDKKPETASDTKPNVIYDRNMATSEYKSAYYADSKRPTYYNSTSESTPTTFPKYHHTEAKEDKSAMQAYAAKVGASVEHVKCKIVKQKQCHLCPEPQSIAANCCPKGFLKHSFCPRHLKSVLNIEWESVERDYTKCAVCSKRCPCAPCLQSNKEEAKHYENVILKNELKGLEQSPAAPEVRKRPRGRPRKDASLQATPPPKRPRGRPRKLEEPKIKRPRGRPRKTEGSSSSSVSNSVSPPQSIQYDSAFQTTKPLITPAESKFTPSGRSIVELKEIKVAKKSIMPNRNEMSALEQRMLAEPKAPVHHAPPEKRPSSADSASSASSPASAPATSKPLDPPLAAPVEKSSPIIQEIAKTAVKHTIQQAETNVSTENKKPDPIPETKAEKKPTEEKLVKEKKKVEEPLKEKEPKRIETPKSKVVSPSVPCTRRQSRYSGVVSKKPPIVRRSSRTEQYYSEDSNFDHCNVCDKTGNLLCCDRCPRSFHMDCIGVTQQDLPNGDWHCSECQILPHGFAELSEHHADMELQEIMQKIVDSFLNHEFIDPFREPVDKRLSHYYETIEQPMDFLTVSKKIENQEYSSLEEFANDVRLIWKNCLEFNLDGSCITRMAECLSDQFETLYQIVS